MPTVAVHLLPALVSPERLAGATVVVIDVLRATTTIVHALAAGAVEVIPCREVDEARARAASLPRDRVLLGGERQGVRIAGFDLGNSPTEYTAERVAGRTVVFTTTNGTRAMRHAAQAQEMVLAGLVNRRAVVEALSRAERVELLCAGTDGAVTREDCLVAGALAEPLVSNAGFALGNDSAVLAIDTWQAAERTGLLAAFQASLGGRNLIAEGFADDLVTAATLDRWELVPRLDPATGVVRVAR